ncbi:glycosyltransferase 61 family protein [Roseomonas sp. HF4]|uniref:glycosyltransferase 61 family protein n=1 Tax=Roseomonas sp. HF4 TaxID=2562313 RepID=UPI0010BF7842|nr:glycosyltransferase 61 family protein [Roseomonas sp. HF4]
MTEPALLGLRLVRDALVLPVQPGSRPGHAFTMGIRDQAGAPVPEAAFRREGRDLADAPPRPPVRRLPGRHIYGGVLFQHFGHALVEGLSRAWALRDPAHRDLPPLWLRRGDRLGAPMRGLLDLLGLDAPAERVVTEPLLVEELLVPAQGAEFGGGMHPAQAAALAAASYGPVRAGRRVWLSRRALPAHLARIEGEDEVEALLTEAGWEVLAPETLPLPAQLAAIAGAARIAGFMGSAFHLLLLFDRVPARVSLVSRRLSRDVVSAYGAIAAAKGFAQEVLPAAFDASGGQGPRAALRLADPAGLARRLLDGG